MTMRFDRIESKLEYAEATALDPSFKKNVFQNLEAYNAAEKSILEQCSSADHH